MDYILVDIKDISKKESVLFIALDHDKSIEQYIEAIKKENPACNRYILDAILINKDIDNRFLIVDNNTIVEKGAEVNDDIISRSDFLIGQRPKRIEEAGVQLNKIV